MIKIIPKSTDQIGPKNDAARKEIPIALNIRASPASINTIPTILTIIIEIIFSDYHIYYCCATGIG